jgi:hypothetical protein
MNTAWTIGVAVGVLLACAPGSARGQRPDRFPATIARMKSSIAPLVCRGSLSPSGTAFIEGTAFFTSEGGDFMTAAHVLAGLRSRPGCNQALYLPIGGWDSAVLKRDVMAADFSCSSADEALDVAHCRTVAPLSDYRAVGVVVEPVVLDEKVQDDGTPAAFMGFPDHTQQPITSRGFIAGYRPGPSTARFELLVDKSGWGGVSGGPVFIDDGKVIGMVVKRGVDAFEGVTVARPTRLLRRR